MCWWWVLLQNKNKKWMEEKVGGKMCNNIKKYFKNIVFKGKIKLYNLWIESQKRNQYAYKCHIELIKLFNKG